MHIIPRPAEIETRPGEYQLDPAQPILIETPNVAVAAVATYLREELARRCPTSSPATIAEASAGADASIRLGFVPKRHPREGYELEIGPEGISLQASTAEGLFRGVQSILQLVSHDTKLAACRIVDAPRYLWRGLHLDVCRHFFPTSFIKRFIDLLAIHKMNTFHWHLTEDQGWRLEIERYPRLCEVAAWRQGDGEVYGGFYTQDDVREIVEYAKARYIQVVPEIELPGHAVAALAAYPELSCTGGPFEVETACGIFDDVFCAGNDKTFEFLENVFAEVVDLFPCEYVHVGGDECPKTRWQKCPKCRARMATEKLTDPGALQSWFIGRISKYLTRQQKVLVGWDEILEGGLVPGAVVMSWRGTDGGIAAARVRHDVVMTPTSHCYFDFFQTDGPEEFGNHGTTTLEKVYSFEPTPPELSAEEAKHILGTQATLWTERMTTTRHVEYQALPRMCALAEVAWTPAGRREWSDFRARTADHLQRLGDLGYHYRSLELAERRIPL
jgi:hexosaminidase